jgi:hypothetical protein
MELSPVPFHSFVIGTSYQLIKQKLDNTFRETHPSINQLTASSMIIAKL